MSVDRQSVHQALQNPILPNGQFSPAFIRLLNAMISDRNINTGPAQPITIAGGVISIDRRFSYYSVSVETGSSDNLDTINGGNEGDLLLLKAADGTKTIVLKDGTGNIITAGSSDLSLDDDDDLALLHYDGTNWKANLWDIG